jgi:hypothetical protein
MRRLGRPIPDLVLSAEERGALENWARRPKTAQATALRARLILASISRCRRSMSTSCAGSIPPPRWQIDVARWGRVREW